MWLVVPLALPPLSPPDPSPLDDPPCTDLPPELVIIPALGVPLLPESAPSAFGVCSWNVRVGEHAMMATKLGKHASNSQRCLARTDRIRSTRVAEPSHGDVTSSRRARAALDSNRMQRLRSSRLEKSSFLLRDPVRFTVDASA